MGKNPEYIEGDVIANKYVVEKQLGESSSAQLYLASGNFDSQKLAVKIYRPEVSELLLSAPDFFLKAGVMTEVEHDNLTPTLDVQTEMDLVFVARPFAEGKSFEFWLKNPEQENNYFTRGLEVLWQVCQGLTTLHERTHHLNIHPGNIIVGPLVAKLCDWDPRALTGMEMTSNALPIRPEYIGYRAPEASGGGSFLSYPSTDLFAIGGILFRLLKGSNPSANAAQTLGEIRSLDKELAQFLSKAMHPRAEERFQESSAFSDALWDLKPAMQRFQEKNRTENKVAPPRKPTDPNPYPAAAPNPTPIVASSDKPTGGGDTFFNFFPAEENLSPSLSSLEAKPSGDTEFGAPPIPTFPTVDTFSPPPIPKDPVPKPIIKPAPAFSPPPKSGLESLESSDTFFGTQSPLFGSQNKPQPKPTPIKPILAKPLAVSLSSLENDPMEKADGNMTAGFTQFGFKDAGENRTGIYNPEGKAVAAKAKLTLLFIILGSVVALVGLAGVFILLRNNAATKDALQAANQLPEQKLDPSEGANSSELENPALAQQSINATQSNKNPSGNQTAPPYPQEEINPNPNTEPEPAPTPTPSKRVEATPAPVKPKPTNNSSDNIPPEPFAVQVPPEPQSGKKSRPVVNDVPIPPSHVASNSKVTPERQAALMLMIQNRSWPSPAAERLRIGDDFNDMGKIAEANMAYAKALSASDANQKQKISALGGLAVTFDAMGMKDQAMESVQKLLGINPRNSFALKLKEKLK